MSNENKETSKQVPVTSQKPASDTIFKPVPTKLSTYSKNETKGVETRNSTTDKK